MELSRAVCLTPLALILISLTQSACVYAKNVSAALPQYKFVASSNSTFVTVPFDLTNNEIIIPVQIAGNSYRLLLDTGSENTFVTKQAETGFDTIARSSSAAQRGLDINIGGQVDLLHQNVRVLQDQSASNQYIKLTQVDGALGYDLMARFTVTIDYARKQLTLTNPSAYSAPVDHVIIIPITSLETRVPYIEASIDNGDLANFAIDTGNRGSVNICQSYADKLGLIANDNLNPSKLSLKVHRLNIGNLSCSNIELSESEDDNFHAIASAGGIGNGLLSHYLVTLDYARSRILFQPISAVSVSDFIPNRTTQKAESPGISNPAAGTASILAKHLEALGGRAAVSAIHSTRVHEELDTGGIRGHIVTIYSAPNKEFEEESIGIIDTEEGFDGSSAWQRDTNGNVRPLGEDERSELRLQLFLDTNSYVLPTEGGIPGTVNLRSEREPETGDYILDLKPDGGKFSTIYLDPSTYLIAKEQHLEDDVPFTTFYSDYHVVNGVNFPFIERTTNGNPRYDVISKVNTLENNISVDPSEFLPPANGLSADTRFIKPGVTQATSKFNFDDGEITAPVKINGLDSHIILDSGASGLALSEDISKRLHLKSQGILEARGYGGSTDLHPVKVDSFEIDDAVQLNHLAAVSIRLPQAFDDDLDSDLAGFIGYDLLSRFVIKVDYASRKLTFIDPSTFVASAADGVALPLDLDNNVPSIVAEFDGLPPARFLIDTGDEAALRLYGPYIAANLIAAKYPLGHPAVGGGIAGESRSSIVRAGSFGIAGTIFTGIPTELSEDTKGGASQLMAGSIGSKLLSRFVTTFDYPHSHIYFAPTVNVKDPFDTFSYGITVSQPVVSQQGRSFDITVFEVAPWSSAAKSGIDVGDVITDVNDHPVKQLSSAEIHKELTPSGPGMRCKLGIRSRNGKVWSVVVESYDTLP